MKSGDMKAVSSRFVKLGHACLAGSLLLSLAACGGATANASDDAVAEVESGLTSTIGGPVQGDCTSTETIDKVTLSTGDVVIRSTCSVTCNKSAVNMGVYNLYTVLPNGGASQMVSNLGTGPTRSAQVDVPYVPGTYSVTCSTQWQEKTGSTTYFNQGFPYTGGQF